MKCKANPHGNWKLPWERASYKKVEDLKTNSPSVSPIKSGNVASVKGPPFLPQSKEVLEEIRSRVTVAGSEAACQILA